MKRTLIIAGVASAFATLGFAAYAQGESQHKHQNCTQTDGKACPADAKGTHQHQGMGSQMQGRMEGMQGMQGKHANMEQHHTQMAERHARMHGAAGTPDKDGKEGEHKH